MCQSLTFTTLAENCALAGNQSVDCRATTRFTIGLYSAKVWNRGFNWPVFGVRIHKKSPNGRLNDDGGILSLNVEVQKGHHIRMLIDSGSIWEFFYISSH